MMQYQGAQYYTHVETCQAPVDDRIKSKPKKEGTFWLNLRLILSFTNMYFHTILSLPFSLSDLPLQLTCQTKHCPTMLRQWTHWPRPRCSAADWLSVSVPALRECTTRRAVRAQSRWGHPKQVRAGHERAPKADLGMIKDQMITVQSWAWDRKQQIIKDRVIRVNSIKVKDKTSSFPVTWPADPIFGQTGCRSEAV